MTVKVKFRSKLKLLVIASKLGLVDMLGWFIGTTLLRPKRVVLIVALDSANKRINSTITIR